MGDRFSNDLLVFLDIFLHTSISLLAYSNDSITKYTTSIKIFLYAIYDTGNGLIFALEYYGGD